MNTARLQRALDSGRPVAEIAGILDGATKETADTKWRRLAPKLQRALGLAVPTPEEADAEMAEAEAVPMTDEEIERIADAATEETAMMVTWKCALCNCKIGVGRSYSLPDMAPHCWSCWEAVKEDVFKARRLDDYHAARREEQERRDANASDCDL